MSQAEQKPTEAVAIKEKTISDAVLSKINAFQQAGQIKLPADYSPENALKAAYLILLETKNRDGALALQHCSKESVANALLKMVVWGLSPLKKQCDFIMYGNTLDCTPEYTGNIVLAKRYGKLKDINAIAIFKDDVFEFKVDTKTGRKMVTKHEQTLASIGSKELQGAYAVYELMDGTINTEIMNMSQIIQAWNQGSMKGNSPAHKNFPDQMACKTVINRACKLLIRGSDDAVLYSSETEEKVDAKYEDAQYEVVENANKTPLDITPQLEKENKKEPSLANNIDFEKQSANAVKEEVPAPAANTTGAPAF